MSTKKFDTFRYTYRTITTSKYALTGDEETGYGSLCRQDAAEIPLVAGAILSGALCGIEKNRSCTS